MVIAVLSLSIVEAGCRSTVTKESDGCLFFSHWTYAGDVLLAHGCGRSVLIYDLRTGHVDAVEFLRNEDGNQLASVAFGPDGSLGLLASGGEAVILDSDLSFVGRFRGRVSADAIAWNRGAWEVADFLWITRYDPTTGPSKRVIPGWQPDAGDSTHLRDLGARLDHGLWKRVYLSYRQNSWFSFAFGRRIDVAYLEVAETGERQELAHITTRAILSPTEAYSLPDLNLVRYLANNNVMALASDDNYEIDGEILRLHINEDWAPEIFASENFELDATIPRGCDVAAVYVSPDSRRRGFNCSTAIQSPRGTVIADRDRLVAEDGKEVRTPFPIPHRIFADPNGDIVVIGPTLRRMQIYSPQLDLIRDIRFELSAAAARAMWGTHRWH